MSITEDHLNNVDCQSFSEWIDNEFFLFAASNGVRLGVTAYGEYAIIENGKKTIFGNMHVAIMKYKSLVRFNESTKN